MTAVAGAVTVTVDIVLVVAATVTPAAGACVAERVSTGVPGGDWLPAEVDGGGLPIATVRRVETSRNWIGFPSRDFT